MKYFFLFFLLILNHEPDSGCEGVKDKLMDIELKPQLTLAVAKVKEGKYVSHNLQPGLKPLANYYNKKIIDLILYSVDVKTIKEDYSRQLSRNFSCRELKSIAEFYTTSAGKKLLDKRPEMMVELNKSFSKEIYKIQPEILKVQADFMEKIKAPQPSSLKRSNLENKH